MQTTFEISVTFICWGDRLRSDELVSAMNLESKYCVTRVKGEEFSTSRSSNKPIYAKTGLFKYNYCEQFPNAKRDPGVQLKYYSDLFRKIEGSFFEIFSIEQAQLQIVIYYGDTVQGTDDFVVPNGLLEELVKHNIQVSISALP